MEETALQKALDTLDTSWFFLLCVFASVCLSFRTLGLQRRQLLDGEGRAGDPFPFQLGASALALGALGEILRPPLGGLGVGIPGLLFPGHIGGVALDLLLVPLSAVA